MRGRRTSNGGEHSGRTELDDGAYDDDADDPVVRGEHLQTPCEEELHEGSDDRLDEMKGGLSLRNEGNVCKCDSEGEISPS